MLRTLTLSVMRESSQSTSYWQCSTLIHSVAVFFQIKVTASQWFQFYS